MAKQFMLESALRFPTSAVVKSMRGTPCDRPQFARQQSLTITKIRYVDEEPSGTWEGRWQVSVKAYRNIMAWNKLYGNSIAKHAKRWAAISSLVR